MRSQAARYIRSCVPDSLAKTMNKATRRLVRLLELAASYNDKGIHWRRDSPAQVQQTRQTWQQEIDALIVEIGASTLSAELLEALRSGAAVCDDSGRFVEQARRWIDGTPPNEHLYGPTFANNSSAQTSKSRLLTTLIGVAIGVMTTLPAVGGAIMSGGMGHGHYGLARALFSVPMLSTLLTHDTIGMVAGGLALVQFPFYGAVVGAARGRTGIIAILFVLTIHLLACLACFAGLIPNFS